eukprot:274685-Pelagomonas_calceolata.AAC.1
MSRGKDRREAGKQTGTDQGSRNETENQVQVLVYSNERMITRERAGQGGMPFLADNKAFKPLNQIVRGMLLRVLQTAKTEPTH